MSISRVDDTLAGAKNLGAIANSTGSNGFIGNSDKLDHFRFRLTSRSNVSLTLAGLTADADLFLLDRSGKAIAQSQRSERLSEQVRRVLNPGVYFVKVTQVRGNTNYLLQVNATNLNTNENLWGTYVGTATTTVEVSDFFGEFIGETQTRIRTSVTLGPVKRISGVIEDNPFNLTIVPFLGDSNRDGAIELYSAIPYNQQGGFLAQYWRMQLRGSTLRGTLVNTFARDGLSANLLNSRREVARGVWRSWVYDMGRNTTIVGTVTRSAIRLRIDGNTTDTSRPFTATIVVERP